MSNDDCIFCKIANKQIPAKVLYEDDLLMAFHDIRPAAPVHFLVIPKQHIATLMDIDDQHVELMGRLMVKASELAQSLGLLAGYRTVINVGRVGRQEVYHLHLHVLGSIEQPLGSMGV